ncbi:MAG: bifunctional diguanylate cyclase/phosphodiesterase [Mycobacteriales bacterium]
MGAPLSGPGVRLALFSASLTAAGLALLWLMPSRTFAMTHSPIAAAIAITVLFVVAESSQIHVAVRDQAFSVSLSEFPLVLGLFLLPAPWLLLAWLIGAASADVARRTAPSKTLFNLGLITAEVGAAELLFRSLAPGAGLESRDWAVAYLAMLVVDLIGPAAVVAAMALLQGRVHLSELSRTLPAVAVTGALNTTLALLTLLVVEVNSTALLLLMVLAAVVVVGYRGYHRLQRQHEDLGQLFAFTQSVDAAGTHDDLVARLLTEARELMQAETSVLLTLPHHTDGLSSDRPSPPSRPMYMPRGTRDPMLRSWLAQWGLRDALLVPLRDSGEIVGVLQVGNRIGAMRTFTADDLQLLQTLTAHAEILQQNGRLLERLRYDAHHDDLTGLGNRTLFLLRLHELLAANRAGEHEVAAAVLLLDLDRFKEVNDTLGHHIGDLLLVQVGKRFQDVMPAGSLLARLGGDEFVVLLKECSSGDEALGIAARFAASLTTPFDVAGTSLEIGASVGVALVPADGQRAATVLQRADIAMYAAKRSDHKVERYRADDDQSSVARLELAGALRRAISSGQLVTHYQPQLDLKTGLVTGFEALVRWEHPVRGLLSPDEFIPIAERVGLIGALTSEVLAQALRECRDWLAVHPRVGISVNLSARALLDPGLAQTVSALLRETGVPVDLVTLEITETGVMHNFDAALVALSDLHALGLRLSVDDFGTGYSSLAYLLRLPLDEVKIDKSFVIPMHSSDSAAAIVQAIIDLTHTLGLTVVAEGVETEELLTALEVMGCDAVQGYTLSRPLKPHELHDWRYPNAARQGTAPAQPVGPGSSRLGAERTAVVSRITGT